MSEARESGWYRVKHNGEWTFALWRDHDTYGLYWEILGKLFDDNDLQEIDETPVNPEPKHECFNYVDVITAGCEGWINLFLGDECIACVPNLELAERVRHVAVNRRLMKETRVIKDGE